jgi:Ca-activated chloride channel family protein
MRRDNRDVKRQILDSTAAPGSPNAAGVPTITVRDRIVRGRTAVLSAMALAASVALLAQQKPPQPQKAPQDDLIFRADTRLVVCHTSVMDKSGHLVSGLPKSAFSLSENGVPQEITVFKAEDVPVSLGLVIDNSGSMRDKRAKVEAAAVALVKDSNPQDEVFVVNFNEEPFLDLPPGVNFTNDIDVLKQALQRIDSRGGTAMRDAIASSIVHMKEHATKDKKVIVVVTDGNDNASQINLENLVKASQQAEVLIYSIGLLAEEDPHAAREAKRALTSLADATGAVPFFPKDVTEVDKIAHQVAHDIRNQYTIGYSPQNSDMDGKFRVIKVNVNAPGKPAVRTRPGWWATDSSVPKGTQPFK